MKNKPNHIADTSKKVASPFKAKIGSMIDERNEEEERRKKEKADLENIDYAVLQDGKEIHRTKSVNEALNLAKSIKGRVFWLIQGSFVSEIE